MSAVAMNYYIILYLLVAVHYYLASRDSTKRPLFEIRYVHRGVYSFAWVLSG